MESKSNKERLAKNTIALYIRTGIVTLVSLYMARALLDALGQENYGIYNIVASIVVTFSFFNATLTTAIQRFMNFALGKDDELQYKKVYTMSILILLALVIGIIILSETFGIWMLNSKLDIPAGREKAAMWAFQFSIITFCIGVMRIPFEASVIAHERMTFFAYVSLIEQGLRLLMVYLLYHSSIDVLIYYAILISCVSLFTFSIYIAFCKRKFIVCKVVKQWDSSLFKQMFSFSGWALLGSTSSLGAQQLFVFLLNMFYGVIANAAMGIATHIVNAINSFFAGFQTSFKPQIVKLYANNEMASFKSLITTTSKVSFVLMFLPAIVIIVNAPFILDIWLKEVPEYTVAFCRLILVCCVIDATTGPYNAAIMASGKIRNYEFAISTVFFLDIIGVYGLFKLGVGAEYILYSRIATRGILNMFVGLFFMKRLFDFDVHKYCKVVFGPIMLFLGIMVPISILMDHFLSGWSLLIVSSFVLLVVGALLSLFIVFNNSERSFVVELLRKKNPFLSRTK